MRLLYGRLPTVAHAAFFVRREMSHSHSLASHICDINVTPLTGLGMVAGHSCLVPPGFSSGFKDVSASVLVLPHPRRMIDRLSTTGPSSRSRFSSDTQVHSIV
jgi:hypothetical protein